MKKRLLLILLLGVSFAPVIFASINFSGQQPVKHLGQQSLAETLDESGAAGCNLRGKSFLKIPKVYAASIDQATRSSGHGSVQGAH